MFVPRKPHPRGNEYHTVACGLSGILFAIELVEGKDEPRQRGTKKFLTKARLQCYYLGYVKAYKGVGKSLF